MRAPSLPVTVDPLAHTVLLRTRSTEANPDGWRIDWADGPWPIKVYSGGARSPLGRTAPLDRLLLHTFAISRVRLDPRGGMPPSPDNPAPRPLGALFVARRPIPSGGAMYPTEAYAVLTGDDRLCHYDPYRHELTDLRHPAPVAALRAALGLAPDAAMPPVALVLTNRFWKTFFKYGDFAWRLGAVDTGVALGRVVALAEAEFGAADVRVDFADDALEGMLGLDAALEGPYAVVGLGAAVACPAGSVEAQAEPCPPATIERSALIKRSVRFDAMHAASRARTAPTSVVGFGERPRAAGAAAGVDPLDPDVLLGRTSCGRRFDGRTVPAADVSTVLSLTASALQRLLRVSGGVLGQGVELCCAAHRVDGVAQGWYRYDHLAGRLVASGTGGDSARMLQEAQLTDSINIELAAFTVHVSALVDFGEHGRGVRGYREQQLAVGTAVDALGLSAAAVGLGSHPVLGFEAGVVDRAYGLPGGRGVHAQVSIGRTRPRVDWEVPVVPDER